MKEAPLKTPVLFVSTVALCLALLAGCGSGTSEIHRYEINGTVNFNGEPVPYGTISLVPDSDQGNSGPGSNGIIENGSFRIPAQQGIIGGPYLVTINGQAAAPQVSGESTQEGKTLFQDFHTTVTLPAETTTQTFDVTKTR